MTDQVPAEMLRRTIEVTDANAAFFDAAFFVPLFFAGFADALGIRMPLCFFAIESSPGFGMWMLARASGLQAACVAFMIGRPGRAERESEKDKSMGMQVEVRWSVA